MGGRYRGVFSVLAVLILCRLILEFSGIWWGLVVLGVLRRVFSFV